MRKYFTILTGALFLGMGFLVIGPTIPAGAAPPECDLETGKHCKNTGSGGSGSFAAKFCLTIANEFPGLEEDGFREPPNEYCERTNRDKVIVGTGSGPGFRFDTNKGKSTAVRYVQINFDGGSATSNDADDFAHDFDSGLYEIDFRFDLDSGGLPLEDLDVSDSRTVAIGIRIQSMDDGTVKGLLGYGDAANLFSDPSLDTTCMLAATLNGVVTRIEADVWVIESDPLNSNACLWVGHSNFAGQEGTLVFMPYFFTIVVDP